MPFQISGAEIALEGHCSIEEAQMLFEAVRGVEEPIFDLMRTQSLHTAIVQIILASSGRVRNAASDRLLASCFSGRLIA